MDMVGAGFAESEGKRHRFLFNEMTEREERLGLLWDETTYRSYDSQLGRFHQVDPRSDEQLNFTPYHYALNNPILFLDPNGDIWESSVDDEGNTTYTAEEGDSFETFMDQYDVSEAEATQMFKDAGLDSYLPQIETKEVKAFGATIYEYEETTYKIFTSEDSESKTINGGNKLLRLNTDSEYATDKAKVNHFQSTLEFVRANGESAFKIFDYFTKPSANGWTGQGGIEARGGYLKIDGKEIPIHYLNIWFLEGKSGYADIIPNTNSVDNLIIYRYQATYSSANNPAIIVNFTVGTHQRYQKQISKVLAGHSNSQGGKSKKP